MTTKPECCTKSRLIRDAVLALAAAAYIALVLFDDVESPLISLVLLALVGYELVKSRAANQDGDG